MIVYKLVTNYLKDLYSYLVINYLLLRIETLNWIKETYHHWLIVINFIDEKVQTVLMEHIVAVALLFTREHVDSFVDFIHLKALKVN